MARRIEMARRKEMERRKEMARRKEMPRRKEMARRKELSRCVKLDFGGIGLKIGHFSLNGMAALSKSPLSIQIPHLGLSIF
jgi:hypothetical protein